MPHAKRPAALIALALVTLLASACAYTGATKAQRRNTPSMQAQAKCQTTKINNTRLGR